MPSTSSPPAARFDLPDLLEQAQGGTLTCPLYSGEDLVAPSSGTFSLLRADGTAIVDAQAVTVSGDVAQYTVSSASLSSETRGLGFRVRWSLVVSGVTYTYDNEAGIVRAVPAPPATHGHVARRWTGWESYLTGVAIDGVLQTTFAHWLGEAWLEMQRWLLRQGNRPHLVLASYELLDLHIAWTWWRFCEDKAVDSNAEDRWERKATQAKQDLDELKGEVSFTVDDNDDGAVAASADKQPAMPPLFLTSTAGRNGYEPGDGGRWR